MLHTFLWLFTEPYISLAANSVELGITCHYFLWWIMLQFLHQFFAVHQQREPVAVFCGFSEISGSTVGWGGLICFCLKHLSHYAHGVFIWETKKLAMLLRMGLFSSPPNNILFAPRKYFAQRKKKFFFSIFKGENVWNVVMNNWLSNDWVKSILLPPLQLNTHLWRTSHGVEKKKKKKKLI